MRETWRHRLGKTADGGYVVVDVELENERNRGDWQTIDHGTVTDPLTLSITGEAYARGDRRGDPSRAGQCVEALGDIVTPAAGWSLEEIAELRGIWERWHLNTVRAGCAHQTVIVHEESTYGPRLNLEGITAHPDNACPAGYRYGSAWLTEELPADVLERVRHLMRDRTADLHRARGYDDRGRAL